VNVCSCTTSGNRTQGNDIPTRHCARCKGLTLRSRSALGDWMTTLPFGARQRANSRITSRGSVKCSKASVHAIKSTAPDLIGRLSAPPCIASLFCKRCLNSRTRSKPRSRPTYRRTCFATPYCHPSLPSPLPSEPPVATADIKKNRACDGLCQPQKFSVTESRLPGWRVGKSGRALPVGHRRQGDSSSGEHFIHGSRLRSSCNSGSASRAFVEQGAPPRYKYDEIGN
jgi:hypothetical protein